MRSTAASVIDSILATGASDFGRKVYEKKLQLLKRPDPS